MRRLNVTALSAWRKKCEGWLGAAFEAGKLDKGNKMRIDANKVSIDLHIIVEYGTNISAIADNIISTVKYSVEEFTGVEVGDVNIFVDGVRVDN